MRLPLRIAIGLIVGVLLIAALQWFVSRQDAIAAHPENRGPISLPHEPRADTAAQGRDVLRELRGRAESFDLARAAEDLPAGCVPVLKIARGGLIQIVEAPPLAVRPGPQTWARVGIILPVRDLLRLSASERSSLLAIWQTLLPGVLASDRIRLHGCRIEDDELRQLLKWKRR